MATYSQKKSIERKFKQYGLNVKIEINYDGDIVEVFINCHRKDLTKIRKKEDHWKLPQSRVFYFTKSHKELRELP